MAKKRHRSYYPEPGTEYLSDHITRIEKALAQVEDHNVIVSRDLRAPRLRRGRVQRVPILWRLYEHSMFYITTIESGAHVENHAHPENVFRYVIDGSIVITVGTKPYRVSKGEWILVRANTEYSLDNPSNPTAATLLSAYQYQCKIA